MMRACLVLGLLAAASACQPAAQKTPPPIEGKRLQYKPAGCDYTVTTPEVEHAIRGSSVVGDDPAAPDHIHVSWAGPTHSTFAVNWRTDTATLVSRVAYGTDRAKVEAADVAGDGVSVQEGHAMRYLSIFDKALVGEGDDEAGTRVHEAHVCGLDPDRTYFYKVGGPGAWSDVKSVTTAPVPGSTQPFRFAVAGDSRNNPHIWADIQRRVRDEAVDFQLFTGDAVNIGLRQEDWDRFFEEKSNGVAAQDVLAEIPLLIANGNHESLSVNYVAQFALPQDVSPGEGADGEEWYSLDYGNAHIVVLNDTSSGDEAIEVAQADWLRETLAKVDREKTPWIFVVHHKPPYSCNSTHGADGQTRSAWQPIYDEFKVDVVFNGHNHNYQRTKPIRGFKPGTNQGVVAEMGANATPIRESGTLYVVSGGAGAPKYRTSAECEFMSHAEEIEHYIVVDIEDRTLRYRAYRLDGSVIDEFSFTK